MEPLSKHKKYESMYKENEIFWGLGVEHETYIETSKLKQITVSDLKEKREKERYCVDYFSVYKKEEWNEAIESLFEGEKEIYVPILINSHTFQKTDINGEHKTTYERIPKPNQKFNGKTIFEWMKEQNPDVFDKEHEKSYTFDGDTVEFVTQDFYNATVDNVMGELEKIEKLFINALNALPKDGTIFKLYAPFKLAQRNYPFASYVTNLKNNAMFNNGTIHINITLPTRLNEEGKIADFEDFKQRHQNYIRAIQWLSPLIVANYGAIDPLCEARKNGLLFAAGSQRVAVSRYIGLGTYDTDTMKQGKILTCNKKELNNIDWYDKYYENCGYNALDELGMDINFNKHYSHGVEFRILESIQSQSLREILHILIYLADLSSECQLMNPKLCKVWHTITEKAIRNGKGYNLSIKEQNKIYEIFGIKNYPKEPENVVDVYRLIFEDLEKRYKNGKYSRSMISGKKYTEDSEILKLENKNEVIYKNMTEETYEYAEQNVLSVSNILHEINIVPIVNKKSFLCC